MRRPFLFDGRPYLQAGGHLFRQNAQGQDAVSWMQQAVQMALDLHYACEVRPAATAVSSSQPALVVWMRLFSPSSLSTQLCG
jgi:hypothetical protein